MKYRPPLGRQHASHTNSEAIKGLHKCRVGLPMNQVAHASNSAKVLTLKGHQVYVQLSNSL